MATRIAYESGTSRRPSFTAWNLTVGQAPNSLRNSLICASAFLAGRTRYPEVARAVTVIDYKTGLMEKTDLAELEDQLHFYTGLWHEIHGDWPREGVAVFVLNSKPYRVAIERDRALKLLEDARSISHQVSSQNWTMHARVGEHCGLCDYRPWCGNYWETLGPISEDSDSFDFEGTTCPVHPSDSKTLCVVSSSKHFTLVNRDPRPLSRLEPGTRVRILDSGGDDSVRFKWRWTEIYTLA